MERTATTLHVCCQIVKALCHTMAPFMPEGAEKLSGILGVTFPVGGADGGEDGWNAAKDGLAAGSALQAPVVLFPKLDPDRIAELAEAHKRSEAF
jgi:methionyl-tRNA synthetase